MRRAVGWVVALVAVGLVAAGTLVDVAAPAAAEHPVRERVVTPTEGAWYCAAGGTAAGESLVVGAVTPGEADARVRVDVYDEGGRLAGRDLGVGAGLTVAHDALEGVGPLGVISVWRAAPVVVARTWERAVRGEPRGLVHGPCHPAVSPEWYLAGMTTAGGATARLVVANPFETDAAVAVTLFTTVGEETPELLRNIGIPARSVRTIELNDHAPERDDLGALVSVRAGRVVAEGWQSLDPGIGEVEGTSLAQLSATAGERWVVPWPRLDADDAWVWVANVGDRRAALAVTIHTADGGSPAEDHGALNVAPGSVRRVSLADVVPEGTTVAGLTVASENGVPIVVSAGLVVRGEEPERSGIVVVRGAPEPDRLWVVPAPDGERTTVLRIVNPTAQSATITVRLAGQERGSSPPALRDLEVGAGSVLTVNLDELVAGLGTHALVVEASSGVVVGAVSAARDGALRLAAHPGVPSAVWARRGAAPIERDPTLLRRVGTSAGPSARPVQEPVEEMPGGGG